MNKKKESPFFFFFKPFQLLLYCKFFLDPHLCVKLFLLNVHVDIFKQMSAWAVLTDRVTEL